MSKSSMLISIILIIGFGTLFFIFQSQPQSKPPAENLSLQYSGKPNISNLKSGEVTMQQQQTPASPTAEPAIAPEDLASRATIVTSKGTVILELYADVAPKTVANFVQKAKSGFYNNLTFHRVEDWVIQGGDPKGNGTGGGNIPVEFNNKPFVVGSLGVASKGDNINQNDAQFFITKEESSHLNGKYTNYGIVTEGMDVVNQIEIGDKILNITIE